MSSSARPKKAGTRFRGFPLVLAIVLIILLAMLAPSVRGYIKQRQQVEQLQAQVDQNQKNLQDLTNEQARWNDPAYIIAQTRQRLYYVLPGETTFVVVGNDGKQVGTAGDSDSGDSSVSQSPKSTIQKTGKNWTDVLGQSINEAGTSTKPLDGDGK